MSIVIEGDNLIAAITGGVFHTISVISVIDESQKLEISPATIVADLIINTFDKMTTPTNQENWPLYSPHMPDGDDVRTNCGVVHNTSGVNDQRGMSGVIPEHPGVQIRIRSNDYDVGYVKIEELMLLLDATINEIVTINEVSYRIQNVSRTSPIAYLGVEPGTKRRMFFTVNYLLTLKRLI